MIEEKRKRFRKFKVMHSLKSWVFREEDGKDRNGNEQWGPKVGVARWQDYGEVALI